MTAPINTKRQPPYKVAGLVLALLSIAAVVVVYLQFRGDFLPRTQLTMISARSGLSMDPGAKVTYNGVQIGRVGQVEQVTVDDEPRAKIILEVNPEYLDLIPRNVNADITATTVFGNKYVSFTTPKDPSSERITASDVIDVSSVTTEFNTLFETVVEVAEQVDPIKLNQTLTATADALDGLGERFDDNPNLNRVLEQLRTISGVLSERRMDLSDTLTSLSKFIVSLGEALASGPYFKVMLANLAPYWLLQPLRRRRLQEARHRSGGVLGQRRTAGLPLPGSQRHRVLQRRPAARPDPAGALRGRRRGARRDGRRRRVVLPPGPRWKAPRPIPGRPSSPDRRAPTPRAPAATRPRATRCPART